MPTSTLIPQNRIKDLVTTLETLQTNIQNNVVMRVSTANRVYGTDGNGAQTTYDKNSFGKVDDVKVNGTSVVTDKVANITLGTMATESASDYYTKTQADSTFANIEVETTKVDKVSTANKVYGTDSTGAQTTYDVDSFGQVDDVQVNGVSVVNNKVATLGTMADEDEDDWGVVFRDWSVA